jgi:IS30 family transposase
MRYAHLTQMERYQIALGIQAKLSARQIGRNLGRHHATISHEINRGSHTKFGYVAERAQFAAERRARRSAANHPTKAKNLLLCAKALIRRDWSPEQVQGYLDRFGQPPISIPTLYEVVRNDRARGGLLYEHLRYGKRKIQWGRHSRGTLPTDRPSIHQRPDHVQQRLNLGDWEGDTFMGRQGSPHRKLCLVERRSRFLCLINPTGGLSMSQKVARTTIAALKNYPAHSITFDNGSEFALYEKIKKGLNCQVYFADPARPGQRGTCENTIGLVRQYIPKGTSGAHLDRAQIKTIQDKLNSRPRKCLDFRTPAEVFLNSNPPVALRT